jgi:HAMP domain-containing protein
VTVGAPNKVEDSPTAEPSKPPTKMRRVIMHVAMRWKLLAAFATAFSIVFVFIAIYVLNFSADMALRRLEGELMTIGMGGAQTIDADQFVELVTTVPAQPDPSNEFGVGYPDSPLYRAQAKFLYDVNVITGQALTYSYFRDPADGQLYAAASSGYYLNPQIGYTYKVQIAPTTTATNMQYLERGLTEPVLQSPGYTDAYGSWISVYAPIKDASGTVVGGFGADYPISYVDKVKSDVQRKLYPVLIGAYLLLLALVLALSTVLVRPLRRLTAATRRIAEGEYDIEVRSIVRTSFPDEMYELAESFAIMTEKVSARERSLTQEVRRLKVEIDHQKREEAVREITDNDAFMDLERRAAEMRRRRREEPTEE